MSDSRHARAGGAVLTLGALGVVFGDIGTSPLYALTTVFSEDAMRVVQPNKENVYGVISLVHRRRRRRLLPVAAPPDRPARLGD